VDMNMAESKETESKTETKISNHNFAEIYKNIYDESPELYRTVNMDGIIISCNKSYTKNLGYSKKEVIGKTIFDHTDEKSLHVMNRCFEVWKKKGTVSDIEISLKRKDGTTFPVLLNATNLYDQNGKLIGSNTVLRDMTQFYKKLKLKDDIIMNQLDKLKKIDLQKGEFIGMISHELKTPLVPIKGYLDLILAGNYGSINKDIRTKLEIAQSSTVSLLSMIGDLLDVQKIELHELSFHKEIHNLYEIVNKSISRMLPNLEKKNISVIPDLQGNIACYCDKMRITQVLTNLIGNAIKYSEDVDKLHIKLNKNGPYAKIVIKDQGLGISHKKLDKIFVKFYQIDNTVTREGGGTGLGLAICKGIIEHHDGQIWAESEGSGKGTEVHVLLPLE